MIEEACLLIEEVCFKKKEKERELTSDGELLSSCVLHTAVFTDFPLSLMVWAEFHGLIQVLHSPCKRHSLSSSPVLSGWVIIWCLFLFFGILCFLNVGGNSRDDPLCLDRGMRISVCLQCWLLARQSDFVVQSPPNGIPLPKSFGLSQGGSAMLDSESCPVLTTRLTIQHPHHCTFLKSENFLILKCAGLQGFLARGSGQTPLLGLKYSADAVPFVTSGTATLPLAEVHRDELHCISDDFYKTGRTQVKQVQLCNTSFYQ